MVIWSLPARDDLKAIHDFIAQDSRFYAKKVVQDIREKAESLNAHHPIGRKVPELEEEAVREFPLYSYRIIYQVSEADICILAIVHKRRDLKPEQIEQG